MKLIKYLLGHKAALCLVIVLLIGAAICDLSIPRLTSNIVDVGIQQSGVEHIATDEMSDKTYRIISMMLPSDEQALFEKSYDSSSDDRYALNDFGRSHIAELDGILAFPLSSVYGGSDFGAQDVDLEQVLMGYESGNISKAEVLAYTDQMRESMAQSTGAASVNSDAQDGNSSILQQSGIAAALKEYSTLGFDLPSMQMAYLVKTGAEMLLFAAGSAALSIAVSFVASRTGAKIGRDLRRRLFSQVVGFSEREIGSFSAASLITRGTNDIQQVQMVCIMLMRMVLYAPILAIGGIVMVVLTNAQMGWIIAVAVIVIFAVIAILFSVTMPKFKIMQKLIDRVNLVAREMLTGLPVIRAFDRQDAEQKRFDEANVRLMDTQLFTNRAMVFMMPAMMLVMNITSIAIVWAGGAYIDSGAIQTGDLIAFITYSMVVIMGFLMMGMISIMLPRADVAAGRVNEVLECAPSVEDVVEPKSICADDGIEIEFKDVSFRYDEHSENVLDQVSFKVSPGQTLAIIGSTGSGKSTVIKLIERFYDVSSGAVCVNGIDVRDIAQSDLRACFGYVPQNPFLFTGTVESNVAYVDESMDRERVMDALEVAQAGFVNEMENGVETPISQGGTNVSGGQRQRLAIARALATRRRAYLFDDSFSALDYKTDSLLRSRMRKSFSDSTFVIVAQRIATVMDADLIIVLEEGRCVGSGTHKHLLADCPEYRSIATSQLSASELGLGGDAA